MDLAFTWESIRGIFEIVWQIISSPFVYLLDSLGL